MSLSRAASTRPHFCIQNRHGALPRLELPLHNNRLPCFFHERDVAACKGALAGASADAGVASPPMS
jgi:hypothetical protein